MKCINNKHGPDFDVGLPVTGLPHDGTERKPRDGTERKPRDGTERKPRDGTERKPRDKTVGMPRDGTFRKPRDKPLAMTRDGTFKKPRDKPLAMTRDGTFRRPRDKTLLQTDSFVMRYFNRSTGPPQIVLYSKIPSSKWRKPWMGQTGRGPVMGILCSLVNNKE